MAASSSPATRPVIGQLRQPRAPDALDEAGVRVAAVSATPRVYGGILRPDDELGQLESDAALRNVVAALDVVPYEPAPEPPLTSTLAPAAAHASPGSVDGGRPPAGPGEAESPDPELARGGLFGWLPVVCCCAASVDDNRSLVGLPGRERSRVPAPEPGPPSISAGFNDFCHQLQNPSQTTGPIEEEDPWEERKRRTGACARLVRYVAADVPRRDVSFAGGDGKRIQVTWMRAQGRAHLAGVKLGDTLASIDGWRVPTDADAENIYERLTPPCVLVFLGFIGKMNAEVRLTTELPKCGLPLRVQLIRDMAQPALALAFAGAPHMRQPALAPAFAAAPQPVQEQARQGALKPGRIFDEVDFQHSNESLYFLLDGPMEYSKSLWAGQEVSKLATNDENFRLPGWQHPQAAGVDRSFPTLPSARTRTPPVTPPGDDESSSSGAFFSAVLADAEDFEDVGPGEELLSSLQEPLRAVMEVKAREARALLTSVLKGREVSPQANPILLTAHAAWPRGPDARGGAQGDRDLPTSPSGVLQSGMLLDAGDTQPGGDTNLLAGGATIASPTQQAWA